MACPGAGSGMGEDRVAYIATLKLRDGVTHEHRDSSEHKAPGASWVRCYTDETRLMAGAQAVQLGASGGAVS